MQTAQRPSDSLSDGVTAYMLLCLPAGEKLTNFNEDA